MAPPQYLDSNGNTVPTSGPTYLDENGNPVSSPSAQTAQPQTSHTSLDYAMATGKGAAQGAGDFLSGVYNTVRHPIDTVTGLAHQVKDFANTKEDESSWQGNLLKAMEHTPIIGGYVQQAEQGGTTPGNPQALQAGMRASTGLAVLPKIASGVVKSTPKAVDTLAHPMRAMDNIALGGETPAQTLTRALKPPVSYPEFEQVISNRLPEIVSKTNEATPRPTGVKGITGTIDSLRDTRNQAFQDQLAPFREPTAEVNGQNVRAVGPYRPAMIDTTPVADAQMASIPVTDVFERPNRQTFVQRGSRMTTEGDPGIVEKTNQKAAPYRAEMPIGKADAIRVDTNAKLNSFYNKAGGDQNAALSDPETARTKAVNDTIRDLEYARLEKETGYNPRPDQEAFGDYTDLGNVAGKRSTVFSRQQPFPLQEQISAADALAHGNPLKFAMAKIFKRYGNSDTLTDIAMDRAQRAQQPSVPPSRVWKSPMPRYGARKDDAK